MYFKILKGTELFDRFTDLRKEMNRCDEVALKLCHEMGFKTFRRAWGSIAGGISALQFKGPLPKGFKYAFKGRDKHAALPLNIKSNQDILAKIKELPTVSEDSLNELIDYDMNTACPTTQISFHPGVHWKPGAVLIFMSSNASLYKPVADMIEITVSEYNKLKK